MPPCAIRNRLLVIQCLATVLLHCALPLSLIDCRSCWADERPKTPEAPLNLEVPSVSEQEAKGKVQATWELKIASGQKEQPSDSELPAKTLPVTRINAKPNNFAGKGPQTHVPGGAYVSDRLLEAHRRMKATGRSDEELLTSAMQASAPKPKSLYR